MFTVIAKRLLLSLVLAEVENQRYYAVSIY